MRSADLALILTGVLLNAAAQLLLKAGARTIADLSLTGEVFREEPGRGLEDFLSRVTRGAKQ